MPDFLLPAGCQLLSCHSGVNPTSRTPETPVEDETPNCRQERDMEVRFECIFEGKKLFQVVKPETQDPLFTGTMPQCRRFLDVYEEKVAKARYRDRRAYKDLHLTQQ